MLCYREISEIRDNRTPVPSGRTSYAQGKRAEYLKHDLQLAKDYFWKAIQENDRVESAILDFASILHQEHRTAEACSFLKAQSIKFYNTKKLENLCRTFEKQLVNAGNRLNRTLRLAPVPDVPLLTMFKDPRRIKKIRIFEKFVILEFSSNSAARKTLNSFKFWRNYTIEWVSVNGEVKGAVRSRSSTKNSENSFYEDIEIQLLGRKLYDEIN